MGALVTKVLRPIKSFNIENRAHRVISKEKPVPAPIYPQNLEDIKRAHESDPNLDDKLDKKDAELDNRLRDIYVTSMGRPENDITREKQTQNPDRSLPQNRKMPDVYEYGFKVPDNIKYGHTTLKDTMTFLTAHQSNPGEITSSKIAFEYKLKESDVENILKYFKTYEVYIPATKKAPAVFAGPATFRKQLEGPGKELQGKENEEETKPVEDHLDGLGTNVKKFRKPF